MISVRKFPNSVAAQRAVDFLKANGVPATLVNQHIAGGLGLPGARFTQIELVVPDKAIREQAIRLLEQFDAEPVEPLENVEDVAHSPDISTLDPKKYVVNCPACNAQLPLDAGLLACPECGEGVDVIELIIERYGPEALVSCYQMHQQDLDALESNDLSEASDVLERLSEHIKSRFQCPSCKADLTNEPVRGRCSHCGSLYDKDNPR